MTVQTIRAVCEVANNRINQIRINQKQRNGDKDNNKDSKYFNANVTTNTNIKTEMIETGKQLRGFWGRILFYLFNFRDILLAINTRATERAKEVENFINIVMPIEYHQDYGYVTFIYNNKMYMLKEKDLNITKQNKNETKLGLLYKLKLEKLKLEGQDYVVISESMITSYINIIKNKRPIIECVKQIKELENKTDLTPEEEEKLKQLNKQYNKIMQDDDLLKQDGIIVNDEILQNIIGIEIKRNSGGYEIDKSIYNEFEVRNKINESIGEDYEIKLNYLEELKTNVIKQDNMVGLYVNDNKYMIEELDGTIHIKNIKNGDKTIEKYKLLDDVKKFIELLHGDNEDNDDPFYYHLSFKKDEEIYFDSKNQSSVIKPDNRSSYNSFNLNHLTPDYHL